MIICTLHWKSAVLDKKTSLNVLIPENGRAPFATLYLLHGLSDDSTAWLVNTRIEAYASDWPMIIVMPDGYRGFYTDNENGPAYAQHIGEELVELIDRTFPTRTQRDKRAVGGLSMGGYGALRLALGYPDRFASAHSHSGALMRGSRPRRESEPEFQQVFGGNPEGSRHDLLALAREAASKNRLPALRLDCGREDFLFEENQEFRAALDAAEIPYEYEEFEGEHTWDYWDQHIRSALAFHARHLGLERIGTD